VPAAVFPKHLVNGAMGPLTDEGLAFLSSIDREDVVGSVLRSGIDEEAAVYALGRLGRMQRDPSVLIGSANKDPGRVQRFLMDHGPLKEFFQMRRDMVVGGAMDLDFMKTYVPLRELWDGSLRQQVRKAYG